MHYYLYIYIFNVAQSLFVCLDDPSFEQPPTSVLLVRTTGAVLSYMKLLVLVVLLESAVLVVLLESAVLVVLLESAVLQSSISPF